jgi:AP-2 complex subunit mu-1
VRPPVALECVVLTRSVVMFTASGLLVRFLKVFEKSGYQSVKWVRYLSKANGSYQIRVSGRRSGKPGSNADVRLQF